MPSSLQKRPWFLLLLPLFFVLHGYSENFGFISLGDALILTLVYVSAAILCYFILFLFFKDQKRSALAASYLLAVNFFFGAIQDFLKNLFPLLSKYSVLLPLFIVLFIALIIYLKQKRRSYLKLTLFLNVLFLIFILLDIGSIAIKKINPPANKLAVYSFPEMRNISPCADCDKPDIYFLLFDEYASSASLKKDFNYDNGLFDTFLVNKGFRVQRHSEGNYNFTPFSLASILNMSYLTGINPAGITIEDYARCNELIRNNFVINFLSTQGYEILNYSIFDLAGNPSIIRQDFLPLKTKLITDGTFLSRVRKDLGWIFLEGRFKMDWIADQFFYDNMHNNEKVLEKVVASSSKPSGTPRFIYAHLFMPHPPFYFDEKGNLKPPGIILNQSKETDTNAYLAYVTYTDWRIEKLITELLDNTKGNALIIFMGDHGFRKETATKETSHYFANQNAVYLPQKKYNLLYDSITGANQFRVIFNSIFKQQFPLLKDSTVFLRDKK